MSDRTLLYLTGDDSALWPVWRRLTTALGTRRDVSMTTYEHCARVMSRSGEARVIRLGIERNMSRVVVTEFTGVTWADNTPEHCSTAVVVEVALRVVEEGSTAVGR